MPMIDAIILTMFLVAGFSIAGYAWLKLRKS